MPRFIRVGLKILGVLVLVGVLVVAGIGIWFTSSLRDYRLEDGQTELALPADFPPLDITYYPENGEPTVGTLYLENFKVNRTLRGLIEQPYWSYIFEVDTTSGNVTYARKIASFSTGFQRINDSTMSFYTYPWWRYLLMIEGYRGGGMLGLDGGAFYVLDNDYNTVDIVEHGLDVDVHELLILDNGNYLYLMSEYHDAPRPNEGCGENCSIIVQKVVEETPDGEIVWEWSPYPYYEQYAFADMENPETLVFDTMNPPQTIRDILHGNSIDVDANGDIIVSYRHMDEVVKVDRETGELVWRMGGIASIDNDFTFINDPYNGFSHQHDARWLPNGNLMIYDNGNLRTDDSGTRVVEYEVDEDNMTATLVWSYERPDRGFTPSRGNAVRLDNGNTIINWVDLQPNVQEITPDGDVIWELTMPEGYASYRANYWAGTPVTE